MKIGVLLFCSLVRGVLSDSEYVSKEILDKAIRESKYIGRTIMSAMFESTEKYIRALNDYIQQIESERFKKVARPHFKKFIDQYNLFLNEARELERNFKSYSINKSDKDRVDKLEKQIRKMETEFTKATKVYTTSYRKINGALTKLDETKIMYTDAEVFKTYSSITVRSINHMVAMEKIIDIINSRANETGSILKRDDFYREAIEKVRDVHKKTVVICDNFPTSILKEEELNKLEQDYDQVKLYYLECIEALRSMDHGLGEKYNANQVKYDNRFRDEIELISKLPFRISGFVTPSTILTLILSLAVFIQN